MVNGENFWFSFQFLLSLYVFVEPSQCRHKHRNKVITIYNTISNHFHCFLSPILVGVWLCKRESVLCLICFIWNVFSPLFQVVALHFICLRQKQKKMTKIKSNNTEDIRMLNSAIKSWRMNIDRLLNDTTACFWWVLDTHSNMNTNTHHFCSFVFHIQRTFIHSRLHSQILNYLKRFTRNDFYWYGKYIQ